MMQKRIFWITVVFSVSVMLFVFLYSEDGVTKPGKPEFVPVKVGKVRTDAAIDKKNQTPGAVRLQWQFLPTRDFYLNDHQRKVNGLALGYYLPQNEVNGVSVALIHAHNKRKTGFSMSFLEYSEILSGVALFMAGGVQYNNGLALGVWNMTEKNRGVQFGMINLEEKNLLVEYDMKPQDEQDKFGVQVGFVNYSDAPGIQFGLWNTNPNSFIKHFPLFNICL